MTTPTPTPTPVHTAVVAVGNPAACTKPSCTGTPTAQYRQTGPDGSTLAYFACNTHKYTDPNLAAGTHTTNCTLFPCNCTPTQDPVGIDAP